MKKGLFVYVIGLFAIMILLGFSQPMLTGNSIISWLFGEPEPDLEETLFEDLEGLEEGAGEGNGFTISSASTNLVILKPEGTGGLQNGAPVTFARIFTEGEIANYPQVEVDGVKIQTQADVKIRWADGSVKHAILTFYMPKAVTKGTEVVITFADQATGNNGGYLDLEGMLDPRFNFDARIILANGASTVSASARDMLMQLPFDGLHLEYWQQGSEATSVIIKDHSLARLFDLGFNSEKSIRPIFLATFYPRTNQVRVRFIGEHTNMEHAQNDVTYNLTLEIGNLNPVEVYSQNDMVHHAFSRWTKFFWYTGGNTPHATFCQDYCIYTPAENVSFDHTLTYLAKTGFFSNYDTSITIPEWVIQEEYTTGARKNTAWSDVEKNGSDKLLHNGKWGIRMRDGGGRPDIGPWTGWTIRWLYTGDYRLGEIAFDMADLAGFWDIHYREGSDMRGTQKRIFKRGSTTGALGKVLSPVARPTMRLYNSFEQYSWDPLDRIPYYDNTPYRRYKICQPPGSTICTGIVYDFTHQPDAFSPQYALTGDYWFLEQMYFWAAAGTVANPASDPRYHRGRGPTGVEGGYIHGETRGNAWGPRNRARTAWLAPEGTIEREHFMQMTEDMISAWEGRIQVNQANTYDTTMWDWGKNHYTQVACGGTNLVRSPSGTWNCWGESSVGNTEFKQYSNKDIRQTFAWQEDYIIYVLGNMKDMGFKTDELLKHHGMLLVNRLGTGNPEYTRLNALYRTPIGEAPVDPNNRRRVTGPPTLHTDYNLAYAEISDAARNRYANSRRPLSFIWQLITSYKTGDPGFGGSHAYPFVDYAASAYITDLPGGTTARNSLVTEIFKVVPNVTERGYGARSPLENLEISPKWAILPRSQQCTNGQKQNCFNQNGVCFGAQKTCTDQQWPFCGESEYKAHNTNYQHRKETSCLDALDNDCDGLTDSLDPDCNSTSFDFGISLGQSHVSTLRGGTPSIQVTSRHITGSGTVNFSVATTRFDVTANFSPKSCTLSASNPSCNSLLTFFIGESAPFGASNEIIRGTSGSIQKDTVLALNITDSFDYSLSLSPTSGSAEPTQSVQSVVTVFKSAIGSAGHVDLSIANPDPNLTAIFSPSRCVFSRQRTICRSTMTIEIGPRAAPGILPIVVEGISATKKHTANYTLDVQPRRDLGAPSLLRIIPNTVSNQVDTDVSFEGTNFTELAALIVGTTLLPIDTTVPINETLVRFLAAKNLPAGVYPISVINTDLKQSNTLSLTVTANPDTQKVLDTDLDGVPNARDKCPRTPGKYHSKTRGGRSGCPLPDYGILSRSLTTNFSDITNLHLVSRLKLGVSTKGTITFLENVSLVKYNQNYLRQEAIDLLNNINFSQNKVVLDSGNLPGLDAESQITFFRVNITNPVVDRDGKLCKECTTESYSNGTFTATVPGWSEYEIRQGSCGDTYCSITESKTSCPKDCGSSNPGGNGGGGGGSGGGGGGGPTPITLVDLDDGKRHEIGIKKGSKLDLKVERKLYRVEVESVGTNVVNLSFVNTSRELLANMLELYTIDLQRDGTEDIELYTRKDGNAYILVVSKMKETTKNERDNTSGNKGNKTGKTFGGENPDTFTPPTYGFWILLIGVLVVIVAVFGMYMRGRKI